MIDMFKALADNNRLKIIQLLSKESMCVCQIEEKLDIAQNLVSHHLSILKKAGIIDDCRCGKNNFYSLNKDLLKEVSKNLSKLAGEEYDN